MRTNGAASKEGERQKSSLPNRRLAGNSPTGLCCVMQQILMVESLSRTQAYLAQLFAKQTHSDTAVPACNERLKATSASLALH